MQEEKKVTDLEESGGAQSEIQVETKEAPNNNLEMEAKESQEEKEKVEGEEQNPDEELSGCKNAATECQIQELMEQVQEKTLQSEQLHQMEASHDSLAEKLHGQQSQLWSTKNELETVKLELAGKKGRLSGFATALDGHKMAVGNERLVNQLHWVEGDQLRSEAREAVRDMLTGDSLDVANNVQRKLGPIDMPTQLFPEDKVELLKQLKAAGLTGMVGDGINDVPALAAADVGIAMGVAGTAI
ncbi:hypothetical protein L7F22_003523 [Adiantum nelumboides]|nr:hypothetical protein [Adiantum nelumboides]